VQSSVVENIQVKYVFAAGHYMENMSGGYLKAFSLFVFSWSRYLW